MRYEQYHKRKDALLVFFYLCIQLLLSLGIIQTFQVLYTFHQYVHYSISVREQNSAKERIQKKSKIK